MPSRDSRSRPSPSERSQQARLAAYVLHSRYDSRQLTKAGRERFEQRFLDEVDPDRVLCADERKRRAAHARKAYFVALALKSARARRARRSAMTIAEDLSEGR